MTKNNPQEFAILNIDKPSGPTSFDISDFVRKKLNLRKTSHFGTLDPKVTGVLPIALNRACKLTGYFLGEDKEYVGIARFHEEVELKKVQEVINKKFTGIIKQTPPVKSRVKRQEREREIKTFELIELDKDKKDILFRVECQGGTYIRKLIDDLGKELGIGAHMLELRRIRAGIFTEDNSITLYELEKAIEENKFNEILIPAEQSIKQILPFIEIKANAKRLKEILTGKPIAESETKDKIEKNKSIAVFHEDNFIGIYEKEGKFLKSAFVMQPLPQ